MKGKCNLCGNERELQNSHVIPKFVYKWMGKTGGKFFRTPSNPNIRQQDGIKQRLLCHECEQLFSINEKWFSENVFYPYLNNNHNVIQYNQELARFIISVLWRCWFVILIT